MPPPLHNLFRKIDRRIRLMFDVNCRSSAEVGYRLNRLDLATPPGTFRFPWGSMEYVSISDLRGQYSEIFVDRHYAIRSSNPEPVIIDGGGNIGMSAIWFKQTYPKSKLTVYEADPKLVAVLTRNLAAANISDVNIENAAVWTHDGSIAFDNLGQDKGSISPTGAIQVRSIDLALHLPEQVDLLKLDIEGAEYTVIERLSVAGALSRVKTLVAEFHVRRTDIDSVLTTLRLLRESGMEIGFTSALGPWLGDAGADSPFEIVGKSQSLMQIYAWR